MESLIIRDIEKQIDGKIILNPLRFEVKGGEFLSVLGPSGCGKTTLLRIIIGLLEPTGGAILKDQKDITREPPDKRGMGIVFQNYALFENMTVLKNVEYAVRLKKEMKPQSRQTALSMLELVGLTDHKNKRPAQLSGGQMQRVAIARTLALQPDLILFDEPMSALDVATRLSLRRELKDIQKKTGAAMIYITHDQEEAFAMSDRIMVMGEASMHQIGTPEEILRQPADAYVKEFVLDNLRMKIDSLARFTSVTA